MAYGDDLIEDEEVEECVHILDTICAYVREDVAFEELDRPATWKKPRPSIEEAPVLDLNPFPSHFCHTYLMLTTMIPVKHQHASLGTTSVVGGGRRMGSDRSASASAPTWAEFEKAFMDRFLFVEA
ncbi:hypothetical protein HAX54_046911 [Datura stramonium]|uniref:Uncharacterized protein n=1 Tax=Datura stramonium TaxID=4076 RepID=A0ABS8STN1_DATST|nr:hypothetical protein [Datura stramonium]